jgi:hypothetical protein
MEKENNEHSHSVVSGSTATFRCNPVDVLTNVLDITRFTMDAVLSVDGQFLAASVFRRDEFVHT